VLKLFHVVHWFSGSGSRISGQYGPGSSSGSRDLKTKNVKLSVKKIYKFNIFEGKNAIHSSLGLHEGHPSFRRLRPSKEKRTSSTSKHEISFFFFFFVSCLSGSSRPKTTRIHANPDPDQKHCFQVFSPAACNPPPPPPNRKWISQQQKLRQAGVLCRVYVTRNILGLETFFFNTWRRDKWISHFLSRKDQTFS
jgi:hypothetical protein